MNRATDTAFCAPRIERRAATLYRPDLPYHNFGHAIEAVEHGRRIIARYRAEGVRIDEETVYYALLFHDAGYQDDHRALGFATKEAYSAHLAGEVLREFSVPARVIDKVAAAILSTHHDATCRTAEQKVVRAADLAGLAADYDEFRANTVKLWREHELLGGTTADWNDWLQGTVEVLLRYLAREAGTEGVVADGEGACAFRRRAMANVQRLLQETRA